MASIAVAAESWSLEVIGIECDGADVGDAVLNVISIGQTDLKAQRIAKGHQFAAGTVIAVPGRTLLVLRSSNTNEVRLFAGARVRVLAGGALGEEYGLEDGERFFTVKRPLSFFNVRHRSFQVLVPGTAFGVKVQLGDEIAFAVKDGKVRVRREGTFKATGACANGRFGAVTSRQCMSLMGRTRAFTVPFTDATKSALG